MARHGPLDLSEFTLQDQNSTEEAELVDLCVHPDEQPQCSKTVSAETAATAPTTTVAFLWTVPWTKDLLPAYVEHAEKFVDINYKKPVWKLILEHLIKMNPGAKVFPSLAQVENKWKTLISAYLLEALAWVRAQFASMDIP